MRKISIPFIIVLNMLQHNAIAQITFQKYYGDSCCSQGLAGLITGDGGYIQAGWSSAFTGSDDMYLVKCDSAGNLQWTKTYGGSNTERAEKIIKTSDGGYAVAGYTMSYGGGYEDFYVVKIDSTGNVLWNHSYGTGVSEMIADIRQTSDGGYIIAGEGQAAFSTIYLIRTDSNGNMLWSRTYNGSVPEYAGRVVQVSDSGFMIVSGSMVPPIAIYFIRTDSQGDTLWTKSWAGASSNVEDIEQTPGGGFIMTGTSGDGDMLVIRTDSAMDSIWVRKYGTPTFSDKPNQISFTADGGYIIAGLTTAHFGWNDAMAFKIDSSGIYQWSKVYGGTQQDEAHSIHQASDGGFFIGGFTASFGGMYDNVYLIRTTLEGMSGCFGDNLPFTVGSASFDYGNPSINIGYPNTIVTNPVPMISSGGVERSICTLQDVGELSQQQIRIYPNPACNIFTISLNEELKMQNAELKIFDVTGREVHKRKISSQLSTFNFQLASGVYFVKVQAGERVYSEKLIVE